MRLTTTDCLCLQLALLIKCSMKTFSETSSVMTTSSGWLAFQRKKAPELGSVLCSKKCFPDFLRQLIKVNEWGEWGLLCLLWCSNLLVYVSSTYVGTCTHGHFYAEAVSAKPSAEESDWPWYGPPPPLLCVWDGFTSSRGVAWLVV